MKNLKLTFAILFISLLCSHSAFSADISEAKKRDIDELVSISMQSQMMNKMLAAALYQNMDTLKKSFPNAQEDRITQVFHDEIVLTTSIMWVELYDKYFTSDEIKEELAYKKSKVGRKFEQVFPSLMQELPTVAQKLLPETVLRIKASLAAESKPQ